MDDQKNGNETERTRFTIEVDPVTRQISVGTWVPREIHYNYPSLEKHPWLKKEVLAANGIVVPDNLTAQEDTGYGLFHKFCAPFLGGRFYAQLRKVTLETWINPIRDYLDKYCLRYVGKKNKASFHTGQIYRTWTMREHIAWMERHDFAHLTPLIIYFAIPPKELKVKLGNALWRTLKALPKTRIQLLTEQLLRTDEQDGCKWDQPRTRSMYDTYDEPSGFMYRSGPLRDDAFKYRVNRILFWLTLKSSMLKYRMADAYTSLMLYYEYEVYKDDEFEYGTPEWIANQDVLSDRGAELTMVYCHSEAWCRDFYKHTKLYDPEVRWLDQYATPSNRKNFQKIKVLMEDTKRLSASIGREFRYCNLRQMRIRHDTFARQIREQHVESMKKREDVYNKEFDGVRDFATPVEAFFEKRTDVSVRVLSTPKAVVNDAKEQEHCVSDYIEECKQRKLILLSLQSASQRTTLGLFRPPMVDDKMRLDLFFDIYQHLGFDNEDVSCPVIKEAEVAIVDIVNSVALEIKLAEDTIESDPMDS